MMPSKHGHRGSLSRGLRYNREFGGFPPRFGSFAIKSGGFGEKLGGFGGE
jgi:hypothetical protein